MRRLVFAVTWEDFGLTDGRDLVWTAQQKLPETLRTTFEETLRPELIDLLRECLPPNPTEDRCIIRDAATAKLSEHYQLISSDIEEIKRQIMRPEIMQQHIQSSLQNRSESTGAKALPEPPDSSTCTDESPTKSLDRTLDRLALDPATAMPWESLSEV